MAKKKATDVKITDTEKTKRDLLIDEAKALKLEHRKDVTVKQLEALIATEKLKADLPEPPPPPPSLSFTKLKNDDIVVTVGPGEGARLLQGHLTVNGVDKWKNLTLVMPTGAPRIVLRATSLDGNKPTQKYKKVRLMQGGENGPELERLKL